MKENSKKLTWYTFGVIISALSSFYLFWLTIFYVWLNANDAWISDLGMRAIISLVLSVMSFAMLVYFIRKLSNIRKVANEKNNIAVKNIRFALLDNQKPYSTRPLVAPYLTR